PLGPVKQMRVVRKRPAQERITTRDFFLRIRKPCPVRRTRPGPFRARQRRTAFLGGTLIATVRLAVSRSNSAENASHGRARPCMSLDTWSIPPEGTTGEHESPGEKVHRIPPPSTFGSSAVCQRRPRSFRPRKS